MVIQATLEHLEELVELFNAYRVWYRKDSNKEGALIFLKDRIQTKESVIYLKLDDADQIVGFTQLYPLYSSTRMGRVWLLNDLFVLEKARGKGYSKELIDRAKLLAQETNAVALLLETEKTNVVGNNLYPSCGFVKEIETHMYHWTNESFVGL